MIRQGYSYYISDVKNIGKDDKPITAFKIKDNNIRNGVKFHTAHMSFITFDEVILTDGMRVKIDDILSISPNEYGEKLYFGYNVSVSVTQEDDDDRLERLGRPNQ